MTTATTLVILFCISTAVAIGVRGLRLPFTVALVMVGLGIGALGMIEPPRLTKELLFTFFLPGLLFEASFNLDLTALRRTWKTVVGLAVPGVIAAIAVMAGIIVLIGHVAGSAEVFNWKSGLLLGAIVAATDPVAVTAVFREVRVPARLAALVEGESLVNDGTGVVVFSLAAAYVAGQGTGVGGLSLAFLEIAGGGVVVGILAGWAASRVIARLDDPMIEIALTTIAAFGPFVLAEHFHFSGVLATVVSGALCGRHGRSGGMSDASRAATESFWSYIAFALNSIIFLLIGFEFNLARFAAVLPEVVAAFVAMSLARIVVVLGAFAVQRRGGDPLPRRWSAVVAWGGLRGALSMVLALAIPESVPNRPQLIAMTIGVVVLSVVLQGSTMPLLVRRLGLAGTERATRAG